MGLVVKVCWSDPPSSRSNSSSSSMDWVFVGLCFGLVYEELQELELGSLKLEFHVDFNQSRLCHSTTPYSCV